MRQRSLRHAPAWTQRSPQRLPDAPLYGLGAAWSGRRRADGTWDAEDRWLSYDLAHFRGRYWDPDKPRLVVSHQFKIESAWDPKSSDRPPNRGLVLIRSLEEAAHTAVIQLVSANNALGLSEHEHAEWIRATIQEQSKHQVLGRDWVDHEVALDGIATAARLKPMLNGFCLVAETADSFLAVSARHMPSRLRLARQDPALRRYTT